MAYFTLKYIITYFIGSLSFDFYAIQKKPFCLISNTVTFCLVGCTHIHLFHMQETIPRPSSGLFCFVCLLFCFREREHSEAGVEVGWGERIVSRLHTQHGTQHGAWYHNLEIMTLSRNQKSRGLTDWAT